MSKLKTKVKLLDDKAVMPFRAHEDDVGYNLTFISLDRIEGDVLFFKTGVSVQPPNGYYFDVVPRSSISKLPLEQANSVGVIDPNYRGEIIVPVRVTHDSLGQDIGRKSFPNGLVRMFNARPATMYDVANLILDRKPVLFQMILRKRFSSELEQSLELEDTARGDGGFGSTDDLEKTVTSAKKRKSLVRRAGTEE
jgi:dUTP pyrophosphatase